MSNDMMNMSMTPEVKLAVIEARIRDDVSRVQDSLIDIGRCLNKAKDERLVPHGQWQEWVEKHSRLSLRDAQRAMQVAREIPEDSPLSRLPFSKAQALLAVPAEERETFARESNAESVSVRELKEAVKARKAAEKEAAECRLNAQQAAQVVENQKRVIEDLRKTGGEAEMKKAAARLNEKHRMEMERLNAELARREETIRKQEREIRRQDQEMERRAKSEESAKRELMAMKQKTARSGADVTANARMTPEDLASAVRVFIGRSAVLPHMAAELAGAEAGEMTAYRQQIGILEDWCCRARKALDQVVIVSE